MQLSWTFTLFMYIVIYGNQLFFFFRVQRFVFKKIAQWTKDSPNLTKTLNNVVTHVTWRALRHVVHNEKIKGSNFHLCHSRLYDQYHGIVKRTGLFYCLSQQNSWEFIFDFWYFFLLFVAQDNQKAFCCTQLCFSSCRN